MGQGNKRVQVDGNTGKAMTVNSEGRGDVVQHAHVGQATLHFTVEGLEVGIHRFILIDISDTANYPHINTDYVHIEWLHTEIDGNNQADYTSCIGFLKNVDASNGDRYALSCVSGTKTAGQSIRLFENYYPNGYRLRSESIVTSNISLNDTAYQTDVNLKSTLNPITADTPAGNGDVILEIVVNAGVVNANIDLGYHTH